MLEVGISLGLPGFELDVSFAGGDEMVVLLGPSGAGKSLTLRSVAGIVSPDSGRIVVNGRTVYDSSTGIFVPPQKRRVGYVPQDYGLFPHLSVEANIAFGLRGLSRSERRERVGEMVSLMGLRGLEKRHPRQLSGGQKQRVALARALALGPDILLLDEPFAALDPAIHAELQDELVTLQRQIGMTIVLVTHDRAEALRLGDRVAVMIGGHIRQVGSASEVFTSPVDEEVATFVGVETIAPGQVHAYDDGLAVIAVGDRRVEAAVEGVVAKDVLVCLRPEDVVLTPLQDSNSYISARNRLSARVQRIVPTGTQVRIILDCGFPLVALITKQSLEELALRPGDEVVATFKATAVHLIPHPPRL